MSRRTGEPTAGHPARNSHPPVAAGPHAQHNRTPAGDEDEARPGHAEANGCRRISPREAPASAAPHKDAPPQRRPTTRHEAATHARHHAHTPGTTTSHQRQRRDVTMSRRTGEPTAGHPARNSHPPGTAVRTPGATTLTAGDEDKAQP